MSTRSAAWDGLHDGLSARSRNESRGLGRPRGAYSPHGLGAFLALILATGLSACAYSREGWGRGRFLVVHESMDLQVRRSTIRVEPESGDLVMNWIGVRAPAGQALVAEASWIVFEDLDGNGRADAGEIRAAREAAGPGEKILFSDVRVARDAWQMTPGMARSEARLTLSVRARCVDGFEHASSQPFTPDS